MRTARGWHVAGLCYSNAYDFDFNTKQEAIDFINSDPCYADGTLFFNNNRMVVMPIADLKFWGKETFVCIGIVVFLALIAHYIWG